MKSQQSPQKSNFNLDENFQRLYGRVLKYISAKPRSENEIDSRLTELCERFTFEGNEKEDLLARVTDELKLLDLYNDYHAAEMYVVQFINSRAAKSMSQIKNYLYKRRFSPETIKLVLSNNISTDDPDKILILAQKKHKILTSRAQKLPSNKLKNKLLTYLLGKGYNYESSARAIDTLMGVK